MIRTLLIILMGFLILGFINTFYMLCKTKSIYRKITKLFYYFDSQLLSLKRIGKDNMSIGHIVSIRLDNDSETGTSEYNGLDIALAGYYEDDEKSNLMILKKLYILPFDKLKEIYTKYDTIDKDKLDINNSLYIIKQDNGLLDLGCGDIIISDLKIARLRDKTINIMSKIINMLYKVITLKSDFIGCCVIDCNDLFALMKSMEEMINKTILSEKEAIDE